MYVTFGDGLMVKELKYQSKKYTLYFCRQWGQLKVVNKK